MQRNHLSFIFLKKNKLKIQEFAFRIQWNLFCIENSIPVEALVTRFAQAQIILRKINNRLNDSILATEEEEEDMGCSVSGVSEVSKLEEEAH